MYWKHGGQVMFDYSSLQFYSSMLALASTAETAINCWQTKSPTSWTSSKSAACLRLKSDTAMFSKRVADATHSNDSKYYYNSPKSSPSASLTAITYQSWRKILNELAAFESYWGCPCQCQSCYFSTSGYLSNSGRSELDFSRKSYDFDLLSCC